MKSIVVMPTVCTRVRDDAFLLYNYVFVGELLSLFPSMGQYSTVLISLSVPVDLCLCNHMPLSADSVSYLSLFILLFSEVAISIRVFISLSTPDSHLSLLRTLHSAAPPLFSDSATFKPHFVRISSQSNSIKLCPFSVICFHDDT